MGSDHMMTMMDDVKGIRITDVRREMARMLLRRHGETGGRVLAPVAPALTPSAGSCVSESWSRGAGRLERETRVSSQSGARGCGVIRVM